MKNTRLTVKAARREFDSLILDVDPKQADSFLDGFKEGEYQISPYKEKRSLNANSYCWVLCGKIAEKLQCRDVDIYRDAIIDVGYYAEMRLPPREVDGFIQAWARLGIGWQTAQVDYDQDMNTVIVFAYYGSSTYNTAEMSRLINWLVQEAQELGIETEDPEKIRQMLDYWEKEYNRHGRERL